MLRKKDENQGFIAIVSLLIIATISMIVAMSLLKEGVDNASLSMASIYYEDAKLNSTICLEDNFLRIKQEDKFNKDLNYTIEPGQACTSDITWYTAQPAGPGITETLVDLTVTGTTNNFTRTFDYQLKIKKFDVNHLDGSVTHANNINIISFEEVAN